MMDRATYRAEYIRLAKAFGISEERAAEHEATLSYAAITKWSLSPLIMADRFLLQIQKENFTPLAPIHAIARLRPGSDGAGISTLVTFYGCPLRCKYCLNPQTLRPIPQDTYISPQELYNRVQIDDLYFRATGGGITFGGGEPCLQSEFIIAFARLVQRKWQIRIESSLNVSQERVRRILPVVDQWIVDVKTWNPTIYKRYTGLENTQVMANLGLIAQTGLQDKVLIRVPLIPGFAMQQARETTIAHLREMGYTNFDLFTYKIPKQ